jgi:hypothetical protein
MSVRANVFPPNVQAGTPQAHGRSFFDGKAQSIGYRAKCSRTVRQSIGSVASEVKLGGGQKICTCHLFS